MAKRRIEDITAGLVLPVVGKLKFELVDVEFLKEGPNWYLRVYIDKPGGITIDDCQAVSGELGEKLDAADPVDMSYILEVSSPGLDRPLKKESDFERFKGEQVEIRLFQPMDGKKVFEGELLGLYDNKVNIKSGDRLMQFDRNETSLIKRMVKF